MRKKRINRNFAEISFWEKALAPFEVLKIEKFYLFWILSYIVSFFGVIIGSVK